MCLFVILIALKTKKNYPGYYIYPRGDYKIEDLALHIPGTMTGPTFKGKITVPKALFPLLSKPRINKEDAAREFGSTLIFGN